MKKLLSVVAVTAVFAACNNNPKTAETTPPAVVADTATAAHNAFTDKAQEVQLSGVSDTIVSNDGSTYVKVKPKEAQAVVAEEPAAPAKPVVRKKTAVRHTSTAKTAATKTNTSTGGSSTTKSETSTTTTGTSGTAGDSGTETTTTTTTETKKKGWSKAAKGAAIGAGTGAVAGAIISKKKGAGAIIGGVIGGAGGYIIGRGKDKKDGRVKQ